MAIFTALYDKVIHLAGKANATRYLALVSFAESSFFPIPADVMLAPMVLANPIRAFSYARIAICFSVCGGIFGYLLGYFAFKPLVEPMLHTFGYDVAYNKALMLFQVWGFWILCLIGCIPIPYKLFTVSAGMLQFNILLFIIASIIGRSLRYFLVSALIKAGAKKIDLLLREIFNKFILILIISILLWLVIKLAWVN